MLSGLWCHMLAQSLHKWIHLTLTTTQHILVCSLQLINSTTTNNSGRKGFCSLYKTSLSHITSHGWNTSRGGGRKHRGMLLNGLLYMAGSAWFPIKLKTTGPGVAVPKVVLAFTHQWLINKLSHRHIRQVSLMEAVPQLKLSLVEWLVCAKVRKMN